MTGKGLYLRISHAIIVALVVTTFFSVHIPLSTLQVRKLPELEPRSMNGICG